MARLVSIRELPRELLRDIPDLWLDGPQEEPADEEERQQRAAWEQRRVQRELQSKGTVLYG